VLWRSSGLRNCGAAMLSMVKVGEYRVVASMVLDCRRGLHLEGPT